MCGKTCLTCKFVQYIACVKGIPSPLLLTVPDGIKWDWFNQRQSRATFKGSSHNSLTPSYHFQWVEVFGHFPCLSMVRKEKTSEPWGFPNFHADFFIQLEQWLQDTEIDHVKRHIDCIQVDSHILTSRIVYPYDIIVPLSFKRGHTHKWNLQVSGISGSILGKTVSKGDKYSVFFWLSAHVKDQKDQTQLSMYCETMAESPPCSKITSVGLSVSLAVAGSRSPPKGSKLCATASIAREFLWLQKENPCSVSRWKKNCPYVFL